MRGGGVSFGDQFTIFSYRPLNFYNLHYCSEIFKQTQNVEVCRRLLGHSNITSTSQYLGLEDSDALEVARNINL